MKKVKVLTIAFVFVFVLLVATAQPVAAASRVETLNAYVNERYDPLRGGYSPPSDNVVRVDATYGAILALDELGNLDARPPPINLTLTLDSLIDRQWKTNSPYNDIDPIRYGGFSEYLAGPVTMEMTYMGIQLHQKLKAQADYPHILSIDINTTSVLVFLNRTHSSSGGFSIMPGENPDIISTYQALSIFEYLDDYDDTLNAWDWLVNETATVEWINDCRIGDLFKLSPESDVASLTASAAGVIALSKFGSVLVIPGIQAINEWILQRQLFEADNPEFVGGFEEGNGTLDPNFGSTYYALKMLELTGAISSVNETAVIEFILNCQAADGSWGYVPGLESGTLVYAGQACELLSLVGNAATILATSLDPNSPPGLVLDWRTIVVVGILLVALVLAIVSIRMD